MNVRGASLLKFYLDNKIKNFPINFGFQLKMNGFKQFVIDLYG